MEQNRDNQPQGTPLPSVEESAGGSVVTKGRANGVGAWLRSLFTGSVLVRREVRPLYPFLLAIVVIAMFYMHGMFLIQSRHRYYNQLVAQVQELRVRSLTVAAERMKVTGRGAIIERVRQRGLPLHESTDPNEVIIDDRPKARQDID